MEYEECQQAMEEVCEEKLVRVPTQGFVHKKKCLLDDNKRFTPEKKMDTVMNTDNNDENK